MRQLIMTQEDLEDMRQFIALKKLTGRKASRRQLEIDFIRELLGDIRNKNKRDAFKHRSHFEYDVEDNSPNKFEKFVDAIQGLTLAQRIIASLLYCGLTIEDITKLTGLNNKRSIYFILREKGEK